MHKIVWNNSAVDSVQRSIYFMTRKRNAFQMKMKEVRQVNTE